MFVAIKIIPKNKIPQDYLNTFLPRELAIARQLKHNNLIEFYESIETNQRHFIVMQYADNGSLLDRIRKDRRIPEDEARIIYKQLWNAMEYIHTRGIVHRDIKCENILFTRNDVLKLIDFGFARANMKPERVGGKEKPKFSKTFCGSYAYASPEILKGIPYQPQLSDIWASGVVLFAMVYGSLPYNDSSIPQLIKVFK